MSKEILFDYLCQGYAENNIPKGLIYQYFYTYLISSNVKNFYDHMILMLKRFKREQAISTTFDEFSTYQEYKEAILKLMQYINEYTGKEIFKPWLY